MITIGIVDDHQLLRQGLVNLILGMEGFSVVFQVGSVSEAAACLTDIPADVVIVDMALGDGTGTDILDHIRKNGIKTRPLILTMHRETVMLDLTEEHGARGYILKDDTFEELMDAVRRVMAGEYFISSSIREYRDNVNASLNRLSAREQEIMTLAAAGAQTREIADRLFISIRTVEKHKEHIKEKLGNEKYKELLNLKKPLGI